MLLSPPSRFGWDPLSEMRRMQDELIRLFTAFDAWPAAAGAYPPVNVWVGEGSAVVTAELPGVSEEDLDLSVREDTLTIKVDLSKPQTDTEKVSWHRRERAYGTFSRVVELPFRVDPDRVQARLTNGLLEVELQRPAEDMPKRIRINAN